MMVKLLFQRLLTRGHVSESLHTNLEVATKLEEHDEPTVDAKKTYFKDGYYYESYIFFHTPFHPRYIS